MLTLFFIIPSSLAALFLISFTVGALSSSHTSREKDAADTWRLIVHRNAISEPIPFASSVARVNAPGLVRVYPERLQRESEQQQASAPESVAYAPTALPAPVSLEKLSDSSVSPTSAGPQLPMELAEEPTDEEREIIMRLWEKGRSMTAIILSVWGIKSGGSARYAEARARYKYYLAEAEQS